MKICKKCKEEKELYEYGKIRKNKDGRNNLCLVCAGEHRDKLHNEHPEKRLVSNIQNYARQLNMIDKPIKCSICDYQPDNIGQIWAYTPDYNKPLDIIWCCRKCHKLQTRLEIEIDISRLNVLAGWMGYDCIQKFKHNSKRRVLEEQLKENYPNLILA
jgi:hypothetical protein